MALNKPEEEQDLDEILSELNSVLAELPPQEATLPPLPPAGHIGGDAPIAVPDDPAPAESEADAPEPFIASGAPPQAGEEEAPVRAAASAAGAGEAELPPEPEVPEDATGDQVRLMGFAYNLAGEKGFAQFLETLDHVSRKTSKRPIYLKREFVQGVSDPPGVEAFVDIVNEKSLGGFILFGEFPDYFVEQLVDEMERLNVYFVHVSAEDAVQRSVVVDIVVDLFLRQPANAG